MARIGHISMVQLCAVVLWSIITMCRADDVCDMSAVQVCLGDATSLLPRMYWNPIDLELLGTIQNNYCGEGIEDCMQKTEGNCTLYDTAPYTTIIDTVSSVCRTDLSSNFVICLRSDYVQRAVRFCSGMFKANVNKLLSDMTLTKAQVESGLCLEYETFSTCTDHVIHTVCTSRAQEFVKGLLQISALPTTRAIGCATNTHQPIPTGQ